MADEEESASGTVSFPPKVGSETMRIGPLPANQAITLILSAAVGGGASYALLATFPHNLVAILLATALFLVSVGAGAAFAFVRRHGMTLPRYFLLKWRFDRETHHYNSAAETRRFVHLTDVTSDTLVLPHDTYVRVVEATGVNFDLLSADEQKDRILSFAGWLNSLDFPVQIVARPDSFYSVPYLKDLVQREAEETSPVVKTQLQSFAVFFHETVSQALDRHFYVVTRVRLLDAFPSLYKNGQAPPPARKLKLAGEVLDQRSSALVEGLVSIGLEARTLEGEDLVALLRNYYHFGGKNESRGTPLSIVDALAPARVDVYPDYLVWGSEHVRVLAVEGYPSSLPFGWLSQLLTDTEHRVDVVLHMEPLSQEAAVTMLKHETVRLQVELLGRQSKGSADTISLENQLGIFEGVRTALVRQEERLFSTGLFIALRARSYEELETLTAKVQGHLRSLMVKAVAPRFQQLQALRSTLPFGRDFLGDGYLLHSSAISTMYPFVNGMLVQPGGTLYGLNETNGSPVIFDRFSLENYNTAIFGISGSGKSYAAKLEILRQMMVSPELRSFIIDPLGEFGDLAESLGGSVLTLGDGLTHLNPLWIGKEPSERVRFAMEFFQATLDLTKEEVALLDGTLHRMHVEKTGEFTLGDLLKELDGLGSVHADRLRIVLQPYVRGSFQWLNHTTDIDLSARVVSIDLKGLSRDLFTPIMLLLLDFILTECRRDYERKLVVVDEAWHLMDREAAAVALANMTRHSRHYHAGITLISQSAADFLDNEHGRVAMTNSAMVTLMRHRSVSQAMRDYFGMTPAEVSYVKHTKTGKDVGYATALLITGTTHTPLRIVSSEMEHEIITTNPEELRERVAEVA